MIFDSRCKNKHKQYVTENCASQHRLSYPFTTTTLPVNMDEVGGSLRVSDVELEVGYSNRLLSMYWKFLQSMHVTYIAYSVHVTYDMMVGWCVVWCGVILPGLLCMHRMLLSFAVGVGLGAVAGV